MFNIDFINYTEERRFGMLPFINTYKTLPYYYHIHLGWLWFNLFINIKID